MQLQHNGLLFFAGAKNLAAQIRAGFAGRVRRLLR